jgi:hypothetical protein
MADVNVVPLNIEVGEQNPARFMRQAPFSLQAQLFEKHLIREDIPSSKLSDIHRLAQLNGY